MPQGMLDLNIGHFIKFVGSNVPDGLTNRYYQVGLREALAYVTGEEDTAIFTAVASGAESGYKNIDIMEPDDAPMHLFGVDWGVEDGMEYKYKIPTGTNRLGLDMDEDIGFVTAEMSPRWNPNPIFGFWLVADIYPAFNANNVTPVSLTPKIWFIGYKYLIHEVSTHDVKDRLTRYERGMGGQPFTYVTLGGVP